MNTKFTSFAIVFIVHDGFEDFYVKHPPPQDLVQNEQALIERLYQDALEAGNKMILVTSGGTTVPLEHNAVDSWTGIMQKTVDDQSYFADVFPKFYEWLTKGGYFDKPEKSSFVTYGNWDLKTMLPSQCDLDGITLPDQFKQWIDLKSTFCESTGYYSEGFKGYAFAIKHSAKGTSTLGHRRCEKYGSIILALQDKHNIQLKITSLLRISAKT